MQNLESFLKNMSFWTITMAKFWDYFLILYGIKQDKDLENEWKSNKEFIYFNLFI